MNGLLKVIIGAIIGWCIVHLIGATLAIVESLTSVPLASMYLSTGLCYPVGILLYLGSVYIIVKNF